MGKVIVPPIKSQGIKTKLVPWINDLILQSGIDLENATWIEPFFGTFNMRAYLEHESKMLETADENGYAYYREVKNRFNREHSPFDFIFLSRAGFNGMMRFNKRGEWNIPFCKKPNRFAPAYVSKICNQIASAEKVIHKGNWQFLNQNFLDTINMAQEGDIIYCDPPYFGRYVDYYNGWTEEDEETLYNALVNTPAHFILSTWHHNEFRENDMMDRFWNHFNVMTQEHFYHGGGHIENRHPMVEALVYNFELEEAQNQEVELQLELAFA